MNKIQPENNSTQESPQPWKDSYFHNMTPEQRAKYEANHEAMVQAMIQGIGEENRKHNQMEQKET